MAEAKLCAVEGCGKPIRARGWCESHYHRWRRKGDPCAADLRSKPDKECSVEACDRSAKWTNGGAYGLCQKHRYRLRRHGDPLAVRKLPPGAGEDWLRAHVDHQGDGCLIWPFGRGYGGYTSAVSVDGKADYAYRHMCKLVHGDPPSPRHQAAHSCGNGDIGCVDPRHLRWATAQENSADTVEHGRTLRGELAASAKLNEVDVRWIREQSRTMTDAEMAQKLSVNRSTVYAVRIGKSWAWLA